MSKDYYNKSNHSYIDCIIQKTGEPFGDEAHIIYANFQIKDEMKQNSEN